jgi:hypothetical protein
MQKIKLRPVVFSGSKYKKNAKNTAQQMFLLKALKITQDPYKLRNLIGVKTVTEVYQTLDKLAMRKEYHKALSKAGLSFDYMVKGIKDIADNATKDDVKLRAFQALLKSVGMEKYDVDSQGAGGTWEEVLLKKINDEKGDNPAQDNISVPIKYDVQIPEIPESEKLNQQDETYLTGSIYDTK